MARHRDVSSRARVNSTSYMFYHPSTRLDPRVYGTYDNGRIEEFFDSVTLTAADIRDPEISRWIGARMAELHSVDIESVGVPNPTASEEEHGFDIAVNIYGWLAAAEEVLALPGVSETTRQELGLSRFKVEWARYLAWALARPSQLRLAPRVCTQRCTVRQPAAPPRRQRRRRRAPPGAPLPSDLHFLTADPSPQDHRRRFRVRRAEPCRVRHREPLLRVDRELPRPPRRTCLRLRATPPRRSGTTSTRRT